MAIFNSVARQYAIASSALHRSRQPVLRYLMLLTILAWPYVLCRYALAYVRQIRWRRAG